VQVALHVWLLRILLGLLLTGLHDCRSAAPFGPAVGGRGFFPRARNSSPKAASVGANRRSEKKFSVEFDKTTPLKKDCARFFMILHPNTAFPSA
jgi:hypothetical protein